MPDKPSCPCEGQTLDRHLQPTILAVLAEGPLHGAARADVVEPLVGLVAEFAEMVPEAAAVDLYEGW